MVVVDDGGGSEERWGMSHIVTFVTFQPWLLDLATRGRLLLINRGMEITILAGSTAKIPFHGIPGITRIPAGICGGL